jgi:hypothetical protein
MAPAMVEKSFGNDLSPLEPWRADILRRALTRRAETGIRQLLDTVFVQVLGHDPARWNRNPPSEQWSHRLLTGESERPDRLLKAGDGSDSQAFPIFVEKPDVRLGYHRGRQSVARVVEWLRKANLKLALLATEQQWRLIYAGSDFDAWCEWNLDLWFESGQPALQVEALRRLLDPAAAPLRILDAIEASRRGQAELTSILGERVRQAVEKLIQSSAASLETLDVSPSDIYLAATRMIMRCVVALFAEGKGMLGRDMPAYHDSYGVQGLREQLERISRGHPEALHDLCFGWPRLIALFRLIHSGSAHPQIVTTRYGGTLFEPGKSTSSDPILRAVAALETVYPCPRDRDVYEILLLLTRTYVKVSQGRNARAVPTPVDFSNLDTEYIGILYEGLLDYDLKRAAGEPVVFLRMGDEPALSVSDLETIPANKLKDVFGKLNKKSQLTVSADGDSDDDGTATEDADEDPTSEDDEAGEVDEISAEPVESEVAFIEPDDQGDAAVGRAREWAREAVKSAGLVRAPRRQTEETRRRYEEDVEAEAKALFSRIVRPGEWYLVRFGNTRKGSGTFYTRKELASPTVRRTLAPLVRDEAGDPRKPEEILGVKVCDPAVGSGSFLISALRYMTAALFDSLYVHDRIHASGGNKYFDLGIGPPDHLPDNEDFDSQLKARLRRFVVERCLYGVDLNPLAIELARMSLWIETIDPRLPFGFLDHKLKPGNSLVGCWFDRFEDYPVMAWMREGGDKDYEPVNPRANWTRSVAAELRDRVKPNLVRMIESGAQQHLPLTEGKAPAQVCTEMRERLNHIHNLSGDPEQQRHDYLQLRRDPAFERLRLAFDLWCGLWFWPGDELRKAPIAADFLDPSEEAVGVAQELRRKHRFFHWELEFPDVFAAPGEGFDAMVGNPPWETQKPNSIEFFSNIDPLYRTYGKQDALRQQKKYFRNDARHEQDWIAERGRLKALSNWVKYVGAPFGDRITHNRQGRPEFDYGLGSRFAASQDLHARWRSLRGPKTGYADPEHPFSLQGSADLNTYKMFLEAAVRAGATGSHIGMLVPGGVYSDLGAKVLRTHFLSKCRWTHLYSFQNERFVFENIDHRFKITTLHLQKGGVTDYIATRFRLGPAQSPTVSEIEDDITSGSYLQVPASQISHFSPASAAILEIRSEIDLQLVEKIYTDGVLLGNPSEAGWSIRYLREFDMTNDSALFPPRPNWEDNGYRADEYGHWLKGNWQSYSGPTNALQRERYSVLSRDGSHVVKLSEIEDVALPLYEGRMIGQFDFSEKGWVSGKGRTAVWEPIEFKRKELRPQYLMRLQDYTSQLDREGNVKAIRGPKVTFMDVTASTNERTTIASVTLDKPCGHSAPVLKVQSPWKAAAVLNSVTFDFLARMRCAGLHLTWFLLEEIAIPKTVSDRLDSIVLSLIGVSPAFAAEWLREASDSIPWRRKWAVTEHERVRLRCILDAAVAHSYGLTMDEFREVLRDCDHPISDLASKRFTRSLDTKAFWRAEKEKHPECRHSVLSLIAFGELERIGLEAFIGAQGDGWMIPEKLRLTDYGLGHDDRANEYQPVASVLGDRFYDWQLVQPVEESWQECAWHAELIAKIVSPADLVEPEAPLKEAGIGEELPVNLFGDPIKTDLFGNPEYSAKGKRRR